MWPNKLKYDFFLDDIFIVCVYEIFLEGATPTFKKRMLQNSHVDGKKRKHDEEENTKNKSTKTSIASEARICQECGIVQEDIGCLDLDRVCMECNYQKRPKCGECKKALDGLLPRISFVLFGVQKKRTT